MDVINESIEEWRKIEGCPDYEVSDHGRVRSMRTSKLRVLKGSINRRGCLSMDLIGEDGQRNYLVHRLVLGAFKCPCPAGSDGSHLDDDRGNNCLYNLEWQPRVDNKARKSGKGISCKKLNPDKVREMRLLHEEKKLGFKELGEIFGVDRVTAWNAVNRISWEKVA